MYTTEVSRGALLTLESKRIASILLTSPDDESWHRAIVDDNILQKDKASTAKRQAGLIRKRLELLDAEGWHLIKKGDLEVTTQLLLAAAIKHSRLLEDFIRSVYIEKQRKFDDRIKAKDWEDFLCDCELIAPEISSWNKSTKSKLFNMIVQILVEARYLIDRADMQLSPRSLHPSVRRYLIERSDLRIVEYLERV